MNENPLNYAGNTDTESVTWHGRDLRIEIGPMPTGTFVTSIIPVSIWLIASIALVVLFLISGVSIRGLVISGVSTIASVGMLITLSKHRNARRQVWASTSELGYSDARTGSEPRVVPSRQYKPVRVIRSRWRPWLCHLIAAPDVSPFLPTEKKIQTLLIDGDRRRLHEFAKLIEIARTPESSAHVRGAFEVIVKPIGEGGNLEP
jgi:hypothetical protein